MNFVFLGSTTKAELQEHPDWWVSFWVPPISIISFVIFYHFLQNFLIVIFWLKQVEVTPENFNFTPNNLN